MRAGPNVDAFLRAAGQFHAHQAFAVLDRLLAAIDPVTGLPPLHVRTERGALIATDHGQSGLDSGRLPAGLVMAAEVAEAWGDRARAERYLAAAEDVWARARTLLAQGDVFVHRRDFNDDGSVKSTEVGEPGKSAP